MRASSFAMAFVLASAPAFVAAVPRPPTEAELLFGRGVEAFEAGRYESAAALLSQAYALEPDARLAFNTGLAYERAGRTEEAVTWYKLAAASEEPALREEAAAAILRHTKGGSQPRPVEEPTELTDASVNVTVADGISGARISVDGGHALALPGTLRLAPGAHMLEAEAPGFEVWRDSVTVTSGESRSIEVTLAPVQAQRGVPLWWFGAGVTGAATAAGVGYYVVSSGHYDEADRLASEGVDRVGFDREQSGGRSAATLSNASYVVAVAAGAVTGVLWWLDRRESSATGHVSVVPLVGPSQAGLLGSWRP